MRIRPSEIIVLLTLSTSCILPVEIGERLSPPPAPVREGWQLERYFKSTRPWPSHRFGGAVALSGDRLLVGAPWSNTTGQGFEVDFENMNLTASGVAFLFEPDLEARPFKAVTPTGGAQFGLSLAMDGDTIVVGAPYERSDDDVARTGSVDVVRVADPPQQSTYTSSLAVRLGDFGFVVAVAGPTVVVGEPGGCDVAGPECLRTGAVHVIETHEDGSSSTTRLLAPFREQGDHLGACVAIDGDVLVAGATREDGCATGVDGDPEDDGCADAGAAYVFERGKDRAWRFTAYLKGVPDRAGQFGASCDVHADRIAVGAPEAGAVATFRAVDGTWAFEQVVSSPVLVEQADFGRSIAIHGDTLAVGAPYEEGCGVGTDPPLFQDACRLSREARRSGAVFLFAWQGDMEAWTPDGYVKPPRRAKDMFFGQSLDLDGSRVLIGAPGEDGCLVVADPADQDSGCAFAGAAFTYTKEELTP